MKLRNGHTSIIHSALIVTAIVFDIFFRAIIARSLIVKRYFIQNNQNWLSLVCNFANPITCRRDYFKIF